MPLRYSILEKTIQSLKKLFNPQINYSILKKLFINPWKTIQSSKNYSILEKLFNPWKNYSIFVKFSNPWKTIQSLKNYSILEKLFNPWKNHSILEKTIQSCGFIFNLPGTSAAFHSFQFLSILCDFSPSFKHYVSRFKIFQNISKMGSSCTTEGMQNFRKRVVNDVENLVILKINRGFMTT